MIRLTDSPCPEPNSDPCVQRVLEQLASWTLKHQLGPHDLDDVLLSLLGAFTITMFHLREANYRRRSRRQKEIRSAQETLEDIATQSIRLSRALSTGPESGKR